MAGYELRMANMGSYTFMFSNVSTAVRKDLVAKIKQLGGICIDSNIFEKSISHLVCGSLKKTEKFLGACISGKWIVSPQFVLDSYEVGMWLEEESYLFRVTGKDSLKDVLAMAARRWRIQVCDYKVLAFTGWRVALLMTVEKAVVFKRLLRHGGAEILKLSIPLTKCSKVRLITHVFVDDLHDQYVPELQAMGCLCLREQFLGDYILEDPPPDPFDFILTCASANETLLDHSLGSKDKTLKRGKNSIARRSSSNFPSFGKHVNSSVEVPCSSSQSSSFIKQETYPETNSIIPSSSITSSTHTTEIPTCGASFVSSVSTKKKVENALGKCDEMIRLKNEFKDDNCLKNMALYPKVVLSPVDLEACLKGGEGRETSKSALDKQSAGVNAPKGSTEAKLCNVQKDEGAKVNVEQMPKVKARDNDSQVTWQPMKNQKSQFALDYLDPNVPSVSSGHRFMNRNSISQSVSSQSKPNKEAKLIPRETLSDQKISNQRDRKSVKNLSSKPSQPLTTEKKRGSASNSSSCKKRKPDPSQNDALSTPHKKQKSVRDSSCGNRMSVSVNVYLHSSYITPTKNMKMANLDQHVGFEFDKDSGVDISKRKEHKCLSSYALQSLKSSPQRHDDSDLKPLYLSPICAERTPPKMNGVGTKFNQVNSGVFRQSVSGEMIDKSIFKTPVKADKQKSPSASLVLSPNIYLYSISPNKNNSCDNRSGDNKTPVKRESTPISQSSTPKRSKPTSQSCTYEGSASTSQSLTSKRSASASQSSIIKRSTPKSQSSASKGSTPTSQSQRGKSMQSVLQIFGFKSTSKDGQYMGLLKPKIEPISPCQNNTAVLKQKARHQLIIHPDDDGEIIVISDDDSQETESRHCSLQNVTAAKQTNGEIDVLEIDPKKKTEVLKNCCELDPRSKKSINLLEKNTISSSGKNTNVARNLFEEISSFVSDPSKTGHEVLQGDNNSLDDIDAKQEAIFPHFGSEIEMKKDQGNLHSDKKTLFDSQNNIKDIRQTKREDKSKNDLCNVLVDSGKSTNKSWCFGTNNTSMTPQSQPKPLNSEMQSSYSPRNDDRQEHHSQMDNLPHLSWPSPFYSNCVTSNLADKQYVPLIIAQCMESSRENGFFSVALIHGRPSLARFPNVDLLSQFVHMLVCDDVTVKRQVFSDLMCWVKSHPPTISSTIKVYSDLFELTTDQTILCNLLERLTSTPEADGTFHLLEFTTAVFEINFSSCLQSRDKKTLRECLLIKWLWSHSHSIYHNRKTNKLLTAFEAVLSCPQSTSAAVESVSTLISLAAECFRLSSFQWNTQNRSYLSDTVSSFALDTAKVIRDVCSDEEEAISSMSHLMSLKPAWFRTMVTASLLSFSNDYLLDNGIQVRDISLSAIVTQYFYLLPPMSSQENVNKDQKGIVLSLSSQQQDDDENDVDDLSLQAKLGNSAGDKLDMMKDKKLIASRVNKVNGKGESVLHIAAMKGDAISMKKLLNVPGIDVNLKDNGGWTPLHEACNHGRYACVELLLRFVPFKTLGSFFHKKDGISSKVDIDVPGDQNITPLHDAVMNNRVDICKLLLKYGGKRLLETKTVRNFTALDLASTEEMRQVLRAGLNNNSSHSLFSFSLSQDSQSEDSLNLSQSEFMCSSGSSSIFPPDYKYEQVLNIDGTGDILSASYTNCSLFISLITLLFNSYLEAASVSTKSIDGGTDKVSLLQSHERAVFRKMMFHVRLLRKHLKKITTPDTYVRLHAQLLMLSAATSGHHIQDS